MSFTREMVAAGFKLSGVVIWRKNSLVLGRSDYQWIHEPILYGWKEGKAHRWFGGRKKTTVIDEDRPVRNDVHPTMKPVALIERMLRNSARSGDLVLDPFGGSGSTLIAAERLHMKARLVELMPEYCDVIVRRWQTFTGGSAVRESDGKPFGE